MLKQFRAEDLLHKPLTARQKKEMHAVEAAGYDNIDTSDIPEITKIPADAVRGKFASLPAVEVKKIRTKSGLSQASFARQYGFNVRTLQDWESSGAQPPAPVRAYLAVVDRYPDRVQEALWGHRSEASIPVKPRPRPVSQPQLARAKSKQAGRRTGQA